MSKLAGKRKDIVSTLLTALMVCALAVPAAVAADSPSNDPIEVPGIAAADSGTVNPSYRSDPPPPPPLAVDEGYVRPEGWWWLWNRTIGLEPASPGATHYFSVDGNRYYSIGQVYEPMRWPSRPVIPLRVVARADTEAIPGRYISPSAEHTRVEVYVRLYWWDGQRWQLQGWTRVCCNTETGAGDYDVDGRFWVPRQPGWWLKRARHRIWRDGILQASRSHYQTELTVWMVCYPIITWPNDGLNQWVCKCNPPCP
ncbi:hypothetical protein M1N21_01465 [Dehalococcoidia bacterium]|nr:hypothetical protein [Dehalococcoidia bacterium]